MNSSANSAAKSSVRNALFLGSFLLIIATFQNCSVYKSDSKKYFEENASENARMASQRSQSSTTDESQQEGSTANKAFAPALSLGCAPYLNSEKASVIFGVPTEARVYTDENTGDQSCLISAKVESLNGADTAACTFSEANLHNYRDARDASRDVEGVSTFALTNSQERGLQIVREKSDGSTKVIFIAPLSGFAGASCAFSFESRPKLEGELDLAQVRGTLLIRTILDSLIK